MDHLLSEFSLHFVVNIHKAQFDYLEVFLPLFEQGLSLAGVLLLLSYYFFLVLLKEHLGNVLQFRPTVEYVFFGSESLQFLQFLITCFRLFVPALS